MPVTAAETPGAVMLGMTPTTPTATVTITPVSAQLVVAARAVDARAPDNGRGLPRGAAAAIPGQHPESAGVAGERWR